VSRTRLALGRIVVAGAAFECLRRLACTGSVMCPFAGPPGRWLLQTRQEQEQELTTQGGWSIRSTSKYMEGDADG